MHEDLLVCGVVVVDNHTNFRNIKTTSRHVCDDEDALFFASELLHGCRPLVHVHLAVDTLTFVVLSDDGHEVVNMEAGGNKHNHFLFANHMLQQVQESSQFLLRPHHKEIQSHCVRQSNFLVHVTVVPQPCQRELIEVVSDSGTEHESLGGGALAEDLLELVLEVVLSQQLVSLIEDDHLHPSQFEFGLVEELQQSTGSGNDDIWVDGKRLKLPLVGVSSQNQAVPQVDLVEVALEH